MLPWDEATTRGWVRRWDAVMEGYVPEREQVLRTVLDLVGELGVHDRVLDIGCGAGSFTDRVLDRWPHAAVTAVDTDPAMLALAGAVLQGRARVEHLDVTSSGWGAVRERQYDAAVACSVLHMVDRVQYGSVVREVARALRPGGLFVDLDEIAPTDSAGPLADAVDGVRTARLSERLSAGREDFVRWTRELHRELVLVAESVGTPAGAGLGGAGPDAGSGAFADVRPHEPATEDERLAALRQAGFREVIVVERRVGVAVVAALR